MSAALYLWVAFPAAAALSATHAQRLLDFERLGHVCVRNLLTQDEVSAARRALDGEFDRQRLRAYTQKLEVHGLPTDGLDAKAAHAKLATFCDENEIDLPFWQLFNVHRSNELLRRLVNGPRLASIAADLLGCDEVRLYQDSLFYKEPMHGETRWHSDLNTAPLDTNSMVTCWLALTEVPDDDHGPLQFATGSHRDFSLPFWYDLDGESRQLALDRRGYVVQSHAPLAAGDATFHHGWCLHAAPPNLSSQTRKAFAVTYVGGQSRVLDQFGLRREPDDEDAGSYAEWINDVAPGTILDHPLLPLVVSKGRPVHGGQPGEPFAERPRAAGGSAGRRGGGRGARGRGRGRAQQRRSGRALG